MASSRTSVGPQRRTRCPVERSRATRQSRSVQCTHGPVSSQNKRSLPLAEGRLCGRRGERARRRKTNGGASDRPATEPRAPQIAPRRIPSAAAPHARRASPTCSARASSRSRARWPVRPLCTCRTEEAGLGAASCSAPCVRAGEPRLRLDAGPSGRACSGRLLPAGARGRSAPLATFHLFQRAARSPFLSPRARCLPAGRSTVLAHWTVLRWWALRN